MVHRKTKQSLIIIPIILVLTVVTTFVAIKIFNTKEEQDIKPELIDLQPVVDDWLKTLKSDKASVGVYFYDLDNQKEVASYHPDEGFYTASLYKLFVVYEGYRRLENGTEDPNKIITGGYTYAECLDLAIRESNSPCAEVIHARIGTDKLYSVIVNYYGLKNSSATGLYSTPKEIAKMLEIYYNHKDLSEETWQTIQDSMLNQPPVNNGLCRGACDWRQGFPSGFSKAKVYNKVGWQGNGDGTWKIYNDAAIVTLDGHTYIMSIMSNWVFPSEIAELGSAVETAILSR